MKSFLITIDTEGDNLWDWKSGDLIHTENTLYLARFQELANRYGFKPTWLSNYEMLSDDRFVNFITKVEQNKTGELGMHLHAWSTPPEYELAKEESGAPYLIEYPTDVMEEKIATMTGIIKNRTGITPVSHRAGRWAMDDRYVELLVKDGYKVDCSATPHKDWSIYPGQSKGSAGTDYTNYSEEPVYIGKDKSLLEIPVSIRNSHKIVMRENGSFKNKLGSIYRGLKGKFLWLRPDGHNMSEMKCIIELVAKSDSDYIMFILHSSEMMPGGSPTFKTKESIDKMYSDCETAFQLASKYFEGSTLRDYAIRVKEKGLYT